MIYLKNESDAEDALQSIFVKQIEKDKRFDDPEQEKAWYITVTKNYCKDVLKSSWSKHSSLYEMEEEPPAKEEDNDLKTITYTGGFKEGIFEGKGKKTLEYNDGDKEIMEGDWKNGVSNGGVCYDCLYVVPPDGTNTIRELYNGYMKDGIRNGMGTQKFYYDNGTVVTMTGEWDNNSMTDGSTVTYQDANGNIFKSGIWKNGTIEVQKSKGE